jgi:hypothetical protein
MVFLCMFLCILCACGFVCTYVCMFAMKLLAVDFSLGFNFLTICGHLHT